MDKKNIGWYHFSDFEGSYIKFCKDRNEVEDYFLQSGKNPWGPFKTFTECKKEAIDYHQTDITTARNAINDIKDIKKKTLNKGD